MTQQITVTLPTIDQCNIAFEYEWETDVRPEDDLEKECAKLVRAQMNAGEMSAWFMATCTCEWKGLQGTSYLGACSYESFEQFELDLYAYDMKNEAYAEMIKSIQRLSE
jgi:hypothetical protein